MVDIGRNHKRDWHDGKAPNAQARPNVECHARCNGNGSKELQNNKQQES